MSESKRARFTFPEAFASQGNSRTAGESSISRVTKRSAKSKPKYTKAQKAKYERSLLYKLARNVDMSPHYFDLVSAVAAVNGDGGIIELNSGTAITQGDGVSNRNGDSIRCKNLSFRYVCANQAAQKLTTVWKVYIIQQFHPDGTGLPVVTDIFKAKAGTYVDDPVIVPREWETMRDYKILASSIHVIKPNTVGDNAGAYLSQQCGESKEYGEFTLPLNFETKYNTSNVAEDNRLLVVVKNSSDTAVGGVAGGYFRFFSRLTFAP